MSFGSALVIMAAHAGGLTNAATESDCNNVRLFMTGIVSDLSRNFRTVKHDIVGAIVFFTSAATGAPLMNFAIALVVLLVALATGVPQKTAEKKAPPQPNTAVAMGKATYLQYCASCHGPDARGTGQSVAPSRIV